LFQNTGMFAGMMLCLFVFFIQQRLTMTRQILAERVPLLPTSADSTSLSKKKSNRVYWVVLAPAMCDFLATYMMNVGLLWINASVWQMVRGSIVFFVAMIRLFWLKRPIERYQWFGVFTVMMALCIIGFSCIMNDAGKASVHGADEVTPLLKVAGVLLVFLAQLVQATQCVVEEYLLTDLDASDMQIVGLEGIWGLIFCVFIAMPYAYYTSIEGIHEDTWDTLEQMKNSGVVCFLFTVYVLVILGYNTFAMKLTKHLNSGDRNVIDTVRTIFIWTILTIVHYTYSETYGEAWSGWSWVQLAGFAVLASGLATYYKAWQLPCFDYDIIEEQVEEEAVPSKPATPIVMGSPRARRENVA